MAKTTKQNKNLTYPCIVNICSAMGKKRKTPVIRAIDRVSGDDLSSNIVYPTLRNAYYAQVDLVKETIDSKWVRIEKTVAEGRQITNAEGEITAIMEAPAPAPAPAKQPKVKQPKASKAVAPAKAKKSKTKTSATGTMTVDPIDEPTDEQILEQEAQLAALQDDQLDDSIYQD